MPQSTKKNPKKFNVTSLLFLGIIAFLALITAVLIMSYSKDIPDLEFQALRMASFSPPSGITSYTRKNIQTKRGTFNIDLAVIDLGKNKIDMLTETAAGGDCWNNCPARSLKDYISVNQGFAGMHGAYFCPPDYASCKGKINYYFYPFYNTRGKFLMNSGQIKWLQGSILVFDQNYNHYYFVDGREFKGLTEFENKYGVKAQALLSNSPTLIFQGKNIVATQKMDDKQKNTKGYRGAIGVKGKVVSLVIARGATVPDMASVMEALGVTTALNLDGGGSSALYWNNAYKVGPGRLLPTAIIFKIK
ncbi:MAG: phosphodiester glycosidase family protein [Patescibacteria group bacterium]|nr:phosphodiester glycosidase family protein [Patescibacteria group bacterium]